MELATMNEELFKEHKYMTQKAYSNGEHQFRTIVSLVQTLKKQGLTVSIELLKRAILATNGETRNIILYLLHHIPKEMQVEVLLKNRSLLKEFEATPYVVANLIKKDETFINDFSPALLAKTRQQYDFKITNPFLISEMIKSDPMVIDYLRHYITKELLLELGFHTVFKLQEMLDDLGEIVGVVALCHGIGNEIFTPKCSVTRFMKPWTTCNFNTSYDRIKVFHSIVARTHILEDEKSLYIPISIPKMYPSYEQPLIDHMVALTKEMDSPLIDTFDGQPMLGKIFSDSKDVEYDGVRLLLIKGKTKTYNLFSLKHEWTLKTILTMLRGKHVIFLDYSCNVLHPSLSIPPEQLAKLGGRKTRRKKV
jgi:hypothetical protein